MENSHFSKSPNITNQRITFNQQRVRNEMHNLKHLSKSKSGRFTLMDLARCLNLDYGYLKKEIWKKGLLREHAERMAALFGVRLEYLEGKSGIRTEKDLEALEHESSEHNKRAESRLFSRGLEYFKLLPNINIDFVENINVDTEKEPINGYKITYRDKNYNESAPIYKTISEMTDFLQDMNEVIEQIIILRLK